MISRFARKLKLTAEPADAACVFKAPGVLDVVVKALHERGAVSGDSRRAAPRERVPPDQFAEGEASASGTCRLAQNNLIRAYSLDREVCRGRVDLESFVVGETACDLGVELGHPGGPLNPADLEECLGGVVGSRDDVDEPNSLELGEIGKWSTCDAVGG